MQGTFRNKFLLRGFFKCFSGLYSVARHASYFEYTEAACRGRSGGRGGAWRPSCAKASGAAASDRNPFWCHWQSESRPVQGASHPGRDRGWPLETVWQLEPVLTRTARGTRKDYDPKLRHRWLWHSWDARHRLCRRCGPGTRPPK